MKSMGRTVGYVMVIMMFSRLLAFMSNLVYVTHFGANTEMDIFSFSLSLPNIVFASLGTALTTVVIPIFASCLAEGKKERAAHFADNVLSLSMVFTLVLALAAAALSPAIILLTRFRNDEYGFAVLALCLMMPVMVFYAMNYVLQGVLQSYGKFAMPALVSVPSSLIVIFYVLVLGDRFGVKGLLIATFIGLASQGLILILPARKAGYSYRRRFAFPNDDVRKALKLIPPVLLGTSAYQLNMLYNNVLASRYETVNTIMTTIQNIVLYSVLAFIYSITAVIYPRLTTLAAQNDMDGYKESLLKVLKTVSYFMVPAALGFVCVNRQLVNFFMAWNRITADNVTLAGNMMALYAASVVGIGIKEVIDRAFYSLKDTGKPALNGVLMMVVNVAISLIAIQFIGPLGIPLAYSLSSLLGGSVLVFMIRKKIGPFGVTGFAKAIVKALFAGLIMAVAVLAINRLLGGYTFGGLFTDRAVKLIVPGAAGVLVYFLASYLFKAEEAVSAVRKAGSKLALMFGK